MWDLFKNAIRHFRRKRVRSALTVLGIGIGVLSVVLVSMIGQVGKVAIGQELDSMGVGGLYISTSTTAKEQLFPDEALEAVLQNSNVVDVSPVLTKAAQVKMRQKTSQTVVWGVAAHVDRIVSMNLLCGRLINAQDVRSNARVCVIDETLAQRSYARTNVVGKTVSLQTNGVYEDFTVIGVVQSGGNLLQNLMGTTVPSFLYAPYTTLSQISFGNGFTQMVVKLVGGVDEAAATQTVIQDIRSVMSGEETLVVQNLNQQKDSLNAVLSIVSQVLSAIGSLSLFVAGLSIMTVMLVTVNERTREIGIKKSIGATKKRILCEFLAEALLLSLFGSIIGSVTGVTIGVLGSLILSMPLVIDLSSILYSVGFAATTGVLFGVYPAIKAAGLPPVAALRQEA